MAIETTTPQLSVIRPDSPQEPLPGALAADPPLQPTEAYLAELRRHDERLDGATPQEILQWAVDCKFYCITLNIILGR